MQILFLEVLERNLSKVIAIEIASSFICWGRAEGMFKGVAFEM